MRTKTILLTAALVAAGVASSMAQSNVYSLNVVGYVNLSLTNGLNAIANPLDLDGTGTNNTLISVFSTNLPKSTTIYLFDTSDGQFDISANYNKNGVWANGTQPFNPGQGAFVLIGATVPTPLTVTLVGQVLQGTNLVNTNLTVGSGSDVLSFVSSIAPISSAVDAAGNGGLNFTLPHSSTVYFYDNTLNPPGYDIYTYNKNGVWGPSDPVIAVGQGFFVSTSTNSWVQSFTVQ
jgi:hypothetical protein